MKKIRVGVIGLGSIFHRVMKGFRNSIHCELFAVAARDIGRAREAAERYGAARFFGSYEELARCPEVDLVYIATPNNLHCAHTLMCLENGKHVICEKPFAMNDSEAKKMIVAAREKGLFLMEAMWSRFMPAIRCLEEKRRSGELGAIRHVTADFSYAAAYDPASRIYDPALGGGAMMDVGIYPLSMCAMLLGDSPVNVQTSCIKAPSGVDCRMAMQLTYADGATAQLMSGTDVNSISQLTLFAEKAAVVIPDFWHATKLIINGGELTFPQENEGHHHQFDHAAERIFAGYTESDIMPLDETMRLMKLMTDVRYEHGIIYPGE